MLMNMVLECAGKVTFCEVQIHHARIREYNDEAHAHQYYEFFRSLLAGAYTTKLDMMLEGTKQAGNGWMVLNATTIEEEGFTRSMIDPNIFTKKVGDIIIKIASYVDNLLIAYPRNNPRAKELAHEFIKNYSKKIRFQMRGKPTKFMGIEVNYDPEGGRVSLSQTKYIRDILTANGLTLGSIKTHPTPAEVKARFTADTAASSPRPSALSSTAPRPSSPTRRARLR